MITRLIACIAVVLTTTLGEPAAHADDEPEPIRPARQVVRVDADLDPKEVVLAFGDLLTELHEALSYEVSSRDRHRIDSACQAIVDAEPELRSVIDDERFALLVAAESMVDACRRGLAASLPDDAFEIVNGDYYTYRELSLAYG